MLNDPTNGKTYKRHAPRVQQISSDNVQLPTVALSDLNSSFLQWSESSTRQLHRDFEVIYQKRVKTKRKDETKEFSSVMNIS